MPVNPPQFPAIPPFGGIRMGAVDANIRGYGRPDLALVTLPSGSTGVALFTQSAFRAAPVIVAAEQLAAARPRALIVNAGNANAATGNPGVEDAREVCRAVAAAIGAEPASILPYSTGVIGELLPVQRMVDALPALIEQLEEDHWAAFARAIMTTDTVPKGAIATVELAGAEVTIAGVAKGSGMIEPHMATMLGYVFTDAMVDTELLDEVLRTAVARSFNRITVDSDTSTNDSVTLIATGTSGASMLSKADRDAFLAGLIDVMRTLAHAIVRDGEGATKFVEVAVGGASDSAEALKVAYAIANSPLVKTALAASDANWGRIVMAIGKAGVEGLRQETVSLRLGDTLLLESGCVSPDYEEARGAAEFAKDEIVIRVDLGRGKVSESVWTSDLTHEYVSINADYRS